MQNVIRTVITEVLDELGIEPVDFVVEHPGDLSHGDYASNVAMVVFQKITKEFKPADLLNSHFYKGAGDAIKAGASMVSSELNPRMVAETIVAALQDKIEYVKDITIAGPGFINFTLVRDYFSAELTRAVELGDTWGTNDSWAGKTVIVEYTDPNPFKELHIGHVVPNALGESLARLFEASGAETKRVTFQGDVGMHVAKAIWGLQKLGASAADGFDAAKLGEAYATGATAFEEDESVAAEIKALNKVIYERSDDSINALYDYGKQVSLEYFETAYALLGTAFDHNFFESVTGPVGLEIVKEHIGDVFKESEGAVIFEGENHGLHTRVFINAEGLPTYETKDVGLIKCKADWQPFDLAITVTGTEQQEYFKVTTKASELIQPDLAGKVELVPNGMLRLAEGKMSSRTGQVVRALSLISDVKEAALSRMHESGVSNPEQIAEEVAVAAIKYTILRIAAGKDIVFDLQQSISFEGASGPYLQYTVARINSLLEKAAAVGVTPHIGAAPQDAYEVERLIYQYPEVIKEATEAREPHHIATYLTELAGAFNTFYSAERIADPTDEHAPYKALVAQAVAVTITNGLWALGIKAPERM